MTRRLLFTILLFTATLHGQAVYNKLHHGLPVVKDRFIPVISISDNELIPLNDEQPTLEVQQRYEAPRYEAKLETPANPLIQWGMGPGPGTAHNTNVFNPCLISAWPMDEGSGLVLHDASIGGTNTANINTGASVTWTANAIKTGVTSPVWSGTGFAAVTTTSLTAFDWTTPFSISAWEKTSSNATQAIASNISPSAGAQGWEVNLINSGSNYQVGFVLINNFNTSNYLQNASVPTFAPNVLHYLVVTYDGSHSTSGVNIYVDGSVVANTALHNALTATTSNLTPTNLAARPSPTLEFVGAEGYVEAYNCALTPTQIATCNTAGPGLC